MKKTTLILILSIVLFSCKNSEEKREEKSIDTEISAETSESSESSDILYRGEFIYIADAAVLKGNNFIYGVTIDSMATELAKQVEPVKETDFDMVEVVVKGIITPKPEGQEGWDEILTIKEIVMVSKTPSKIDINIEDSKE